MSGRLTVEIWVRIGSTVIDNFGLTATQHEREHERSHGTFFNIAKDRINPIEGFYCYKKCADLAGSWGQWEYSYYNFRAIEENTRGDLKAYGNRMTPFQYQSYLNRMNTARQLAQQARVQADLHRQKLNEEGCSVYYKACPR